MKRFYMIAHPAYFKRTMGWDMKHYEKKETETIVYIACEYFREDAFEPYVTFLDTDNREVAHIPYINISKEGE